ncbi:DUF3710 domain-containing protein [Streptomyces sp. NPDC057696]|uniref:DUF3710 domain-containing protein n=1 Tax=Streptomyces sp. NPDC057696 TaxID=3346218 RepID=UPI0036C7AAF2
MLSANQALRGCAVTNREARWRHAGRGFFDLDGLRIPANEGVRLLPIAGGKSGTVVAVTTVRGRTAIQLQAFHVSAGRSWDSVRLELLARIRRDGGTAEEVIGPSGSGIQARVPVVTPGGEQKVMDVRFVGRDGPGWLLRGTVSGAGAAPGSAEAWPCEVFDETAVKSTALIAPDSLAMELQWPPGEATN